MSANPPRAAALGLILTLSAAPGAWSQPANSAAFKELVQLGGDTEQAAPPLPEPMGRILSGTGVRRINVPCRQQPRSKLLASSPYSYANLSRLLRQGSKPDEAQVAGDWKLVAEIEFVTRNGEKPKPHCIPFVISSDSNGLWSEDAPRFPQPEIEFSGRSVSVRNYHGLKMNTLNNEDSARYAESPDAITFTIPLPYAESVTRKPQKSHWTCRLLGGDESKLVCETTGARFLIPEFLIFSRRNAEESFETGGSLLAPFMTSDLPNPTMKRSKPKD